jgi:1,4-alpha-glucan branching enzyme
MPVIKQPKIKVTFTYSAANAREVMLAGDFTGWEQAPLAMKKSKTGVWSKSLSLPPGEYHYRLLVDGQWKDDPSCPHRRPNQYGGENCLCIVAAGQMETQPRAK